MSDGETPTLRTLSSHSGAAFEAGSTEEHNGSLLMLKIKYLSGPRTGKELIRSSKYLKVE